jgi:uncharacterized OsmC-like protein
MFDTGVKEQKTINGVNIDELIGTIEAIKEQPELATLQFRASNKWVNGANNRTTINEVYGAGQEHRRANPFVLEKDEPLFLLGNDKGANPVEYALAALAGCLTTTLVCLAATEGVQLNEVTSRFEADASLLGFLGLDENTRMGCDKIRVTFDIKSDAPREKIQALVALAQARSAVFDMITNKTPVSVMLE